MMFEAFHHSLFLSGLFLISLTFVPAIMKKDGYIPIVKDEETVSFVSNDKILEEKINEIVSTVYDKENYRFEITAKRIPSMLEDSSTEILTVHQAGQGLPKGYTIFDVDYSRNGKRYQTKTQFDIKVLQKLPVSLNRIQSGTLLDTTQFAFQWVDITNLRGVLVSDMNQIVGKVASGMLRSGNPVRPSDLQNPPIVKAGQQLTMTYSKAGIQLALQVLSRVDAARHDVINVYCEGTRKTYRAKVLSSEKVQWEQTL